MFADSLHLRLLLQLILLEPAEGVVLDLLPELRSTALALLVQVPVVLDDILDGLALLFVVVKVLLLLFNVIGPHILI